MYCILKDNIIVATCDFLPSLDDLATRNEKVVETNHDVKIGQIYNELDNTFSDIIDVPANIIIEDKEQIIRSKRDILLMFSDKYMLLDYPITEEKRNDWRIYRQELRDFPATCDINNPIWPTPPQ